MGSLYRRAWTAGHPIWSGCYAARAHSSPLRRDSASHDLIHPALDALPQELLQRHVPAPRDRLGLLQDAPGERDSDGMCNRSSHP